MEYFLINLADMPVAWSGMIENTTSPSERLSPICKPLRHLRSSLTPFGFLGTGRSEAAVPPHIATGKFVMWSGHDLLTIAATPDHEAVYAFNMAVSTETGLEDIDPAPIVPMQDTVKAMVAAQAAVVQTGYAAPSQARP